MIRQPEYERPNQLVLRKGISVLCHCLPARLAKPPPQPRCRTHSTPFLGERNRSWKPRGQRAAILAEPSGKRLAGTTRNPARARQVARSPGCKVELAVGLNVLQLTDSDVFGERLRLRNGRLVFKQTMHVHFNCLVHIARDLLTGPAGRHATGQIGRVS